MKKSLVGLAVVASGLGAFPAGAAEIYSLDGVTINLTGEVEIQYYKPQAKKYQSEWNLNEAKFGFEINYEMTEDLLMGAHLDVDTNNTDFDDDSTNNDDVTRGDVYGIVKLFGSNTITFGSQSTIFDDSGIGDDYMFGFTSYVDNLNNNGDQVIKYQYDGGETFYGGVSYLQYKNSDITTTNDGNHSSSDYQADGKIGARVGDADFRLFLVHAQTKGLDEFTYDLEGRYTFGDWNFAATYGNTSTEQAASNTDKDKTRYGLTASYFDGGRLEYAAGWANTDTDHSTTASDNENINDYYVNVTYSLSDEVAVYAEVGLTDEDNTDTGYVIGLDATF